MPPEDLAGSARAALVSALPADAARLRVRPPDPYVYPSRAKRAGARALDLVGGLILGRRPPAVDWSRVRRVALIRLDHLGDLVLALPALRRLRLALPQAKIDLWVGPWGRDLGALFADADAVHVAEAPWFARPRREDWPWASIGALGRGLRAGNYDAAFELRGELRHLLALRLSGIPVRAGQAVTAGGFLLSHPVRWFAGMQEAQQSLSLLDQVGLAPAEQGSAPYLKLPAASLREAAALSKSLKLGATPILVQAGGGAPSRLWTPEAWAAVLRGLPSAAPVALLGSDGEAAAMRAIAARVKRPVAVAAGRLSMATLAALVGEARLVLAVNTGVAHLAAIQGRPLVVVFSAANEAARWAPKGPKVRVLTAEGFPCAPCERSECPYDQACMRAVSPREVLLQAQGLLKAGAPPRKRRT
ncbi:MAG TPA: glycosyltransferase family 9 protein [bacterium]|jgi:ADP-heptose:LPS heptosyltransferase|nr:glycosyltransferase family 9 protein [bacterium]